MAFDGIPTFATMKPSRRWGTLFATEGFEVREKPTSQKRDVGHPAFPLLGELRVRIGSVRVRVC